MKGICASLLLAALVITSAQAETILIPIGQQGRDSEHRELPKKGSLTSQIESRYGTPSKVNPAIGEPPISSWEYEGFIVYFEYNHVIHTVLKHHPQNIDQ